MGMAPSLNGRESPSGASPLWEVHADAWVFPSLETAHFLARARAARAESAIERLRQAVAGLEGRGDIVSGGLKAGLRYFLGAQSPQARQLADSPAFHAWLYLTRRFLEPGARLGGSQAAALDCFSGFAASLACLLGEGLRARARLDERGHFHLHGLRTYLDLGARHAGAWLDLTFSADGLEAAPAQGSPAKIGRGVLLEGRTDTNRPGGSGNGISYPGLVVRWQPIVFGNMEVNECDSLIVAAARAAADSYAHAPISLTPGARLAFIGVLRQALDRIREVDALLAAQISECIRLIVPLRREDPTRHVSSTYSHLPGAIFLCHDSNPSLQAETLVHEFCHDALHALLARDPLFIGGEAEALYYSPWREDPRPLRGILLGAHAFLNVARFQALSAKAAGPGDAALALRTESAMRCLQVQGALFSLSARGRFTDLGRGLIEAMRRRLKEVLGLLPPGPGGLWGAAEEPVKRHAGLFAGASGYHKKRVA